MKILLIHFEDDPEKGPWASLPWDRVVDLGMGGVKSYERWARKMQCPITTLDSFRDGLDTLFRARELLGLGGKRLVDQYGLDWWEILSLLLHDEVKTLILLRRFVHTLG